MSLMGGLPLFEGSAAKVGSIPVKNWPLQGLNPAAPQADGESLGPAAVAKDIIWGMVDRAEERKYDGCLSSQSGLRSCHSDERKCDGNQAPQSGPRSSPVKWQGQGLQCAGDVDETIKRCVADEVETMTIYIYI